MTLSDLVKYSMTRRTARPLCDSWVFLSIFFHRQLAANLTVLAHEATIYNEVRVYRFHVNQNTLTPKGTPRLRFMSILLLSCTFSVLYKHAIADEVLFLVTCVCVCVCVWVCSPENVLFIIIKLSDLMSNVSQSCQLIFWNKYQRNKKVANRFK